MQPSTLAQVTDLTGRLLSGSAVPPFVQFAFAVAIGAAALVLCAPLATHSWRLRRERRVRCVHCDSRMQRGGAPLLFFRGAGLWCADCIRSTDRPPAVERSPLTTPEPVAVADGNAAPSTGAAAHGADRIEEVTCHAAA